MDGFTVIILASLFVFCLPILFDGIVNIIHAWRDKDD